MATHNGRYIQAKIDPEFKDKIEEVALKRIKQGVDTKLGKEQKSIRRFTKVMTRYEPLWDLLAKAQFKEDMK